MVNSYSIAACDQLLSRKLAILVSESTYSAGNGRGYAHCFTKPRRQWVGHSLRKFKVKLSRVGCLCKGSGSTWNGAASQTQTPLTPSNSQPWSTLKMSDFFRNPNACKLPGPLRQCFTSTLQARETKTGKGGPAVLRMLLFITHCVSKSQRLTNLRSDEFTLIE